MVDILGETYVTVDKADGVLWRGDLLVFDPACSADCKVYMVCLDDNAQGFRLINYIGHKAGAYMSARIPEVASTPDALNIRLSWLRDNWDDVIPIGAFETTAFLKWNGSAAVDA